MKVSIMKKITLILGLLPLSCFAVVYQFDPAPYLQSMQAKYPGGVYSVYTYCNTKYVQKSKALQALGVSQSDNPDGFNRYNFMATCIYGQKVFKVANCGFGGTSCQKVTLPIALSALESITKNIAPHKIGARAPANIY